MSMVTLIVLADPKFKTDIAFFMGALPAGPMIMTLQLLLVLAIPLAGLLLHRWYRGLHA